MQSLGQCITQIIHSQKPRTFNKLLMTLKALFTPILKKVGTSQAVIDQIFSDEPKDDYPEIAASFKQLMTPEYAVSDTNTRNRIRKDSFIKLESTIQSEVTNKGYLTSSQLDEAIQGKDQFTDQVISILKMVVGFADEKASSRFKNKIEELESRAAGGDATKDNRIAALEKEVEKFKGAKEESDTKYTGAMQKHEEYLIKQGLLKHLNGKKYTTDTAGYIEYAKKDIIDKCYKLAVLKLDENKLVIVRDKSNTEAPFYFPEDMMNPVTPKQLVLKCAEEHLQKSPNGGSGGNGNPGSEGNPFSGNKGNPNPKLNQKKPDDGQNIKLTNSQKAAAKKNKEQYKKMGLLE